jgi:hypothetical protein
MGGAAGHMRHPYDLGSVVSGNDLIQFFYKLKEYAKEAAENINVKIDGVNVSFKLVKTQAGYEFAVDRGSLKQIDLEGVTLSRVGERFPEGHGMRPAITTLLTILNKALPDIMSELNSFGMLRDTTLFLNTEYVTGTTNAVGYQENFIAIHGLNQFYKKVPRSKKALTRLGAERPMGSSGKPIKDPSREVPYDQKSMGTLINKLNKVASEYNFKVYGPIPTSKREVVIDYKTTLSIPFSVNVSDEYSDSYSDLTHLNGRPLIEWLDSITEKPGYYPSYAPIKTTEGKVINPYHKKTYLKIMGKQDPVDSFIVGEDVRSIVNGAVMIHATRLLGNDFLKGLTSEIGDLVNDDGGHEGVVIRDTRFSQHPFKITGEFIVSGMYGVIADKMKLSEEIIRFFIRESLLKSYSKL